MHKIILIAACLVLMTSCEEPDYGDKAKRFVDSEFHNVSRESVHADLENRWFVSFAVAHGELDVRLRRIVAELQRIPDPEPAPNNAGPAAWLGSLRATEAATGKLLSISRELQLARRMHSNLVGICNSKEAFFQARLDQLGQISPLQGLPRLEPNYGFKLTLLILDGVIETLIQNDKARKIKEQNDVLEEARLKALKVAIQGEELFTLSSAICNGELQRFAPMTTRVYELLQKALELADTRSRSYSAVRLIEEARLIPVQIEGSSEELQHEVTSVNESFINGQILIDSQLLRNRLVGLRKAAEAAGNCRAGAAAVELYQDALAETRVQLSALEGYDFPISVRGRLTALEVEAKNGTERISELLQALRSRECAN